MIYSGSPSSFYPFSSSPLLPFSSLSFPPPPSPSPSLLLPLPLPSQLKDYHRRYPSDVEEPMQMEFLKLDKERENPPEELQSMLLSVSVCRCSLCVREHVPVHTSILVPLCPTHTLPPSQISWNLQVWYKYLNLHQCYDCYINLKQLEVSQPEYMCGLIGVRPTVTNQVHPHMRAWERGHRYGSCNVQLFVKSLLISVSGIQTLCQSC